MSYQTLGFWLTQLSLLAPSGGDFDGVKAANSARDCGSSSANPLSTPTRRMRAARRACAASTTLPPRQTPRDELPPSPQICLCWIDSLSRSGLHVWP
jgi:hypothetical protein